MPDLSHECANGRLDGAPVAGIDEVGRGPLAGPVVAAAVVLPADEVLPEGLLAALDDSKTLGTAVRTGLCARILEHAHVGIGCASVAEIDRMNIMNATFLAMTRAVDALTRRMGCPPSVALVDGNRAPQLPCPARPVVGGDALCCSIAAASVVAKVTRDRLMARLAARYAGYGWETNVGYGTAAHRKALTSLGVTPHHRRSFSPVSACLAPSY